MTSKLAPLRWEIRQEYPHYKISQHNIIIDVVGGVSRETLHSIKELIGVRQDSTGYAKGGHRKYP